MDPRHTFAHFALLPGAGNLVPTGREGRVDIWFENTCSRIMATAVFFLSSLPVVTHANVLTHIPAGEIVPPPLGAVDLCKRIRSACSTIRLIKIDYVNEMEVARRVNLEVNKSISSISDLEQYGKADVWALPTSRGGDCEDFALEKKHRLIQLGLEPRHLLLATVLDGDLNSHAVLILRQTGGDYVLDNLNNSIKHWTDTPYTFIRMQDPGAPERWTIAMSGGLFDGGPTSTITPCIGLS